MASDCGYALVASEQAFLLALGQLLVWLLLQSRWLPQKFGVDQDHCGALSSDHIFGQDCLQLLAQLLVLFIQFHHNGDQRLLVEIAQCLWRQFCYVRSLACLFHDAVNGITFDAHFDSEFFNGDEIADTASVVLRLPGLCQRGLRQIGGPYSEPGKSSRLSSQEKLPCSSLL